GLPHVEITNGSDATSKESVRFTPNGTRNVKLSRQELAKELGVPPNQIHEADGLYFLFKHLASVTQSTPGSTVIEYELDLRAVYDRLAEIYDQIGIKGYNRLGSIYPRPASPEQADPVLERLLHPHIKLRQVDGLLGAPNTSIAVDMEELGTSLST